MQRTVALLGLVAHRRRRPTHCAQQDRPTTVRQSEQQQTDSEREGERRRPVEAGAKMSGPQTGLVPLQNSAASHPPICRQPHNFPSQRFRETPVSNSPGAASRHMVDAGANTSGGHIVSLHTHAHTQGQSRSCLEQNSKRNTSVCCTYFPLQYSSTSHTPSDTRHLMPIAINRQTYHERTKSS